MQKVHSAQATGVEMGNFGFFCSAELIAQNLCYLRAQLGYTQQRMAEVIELSESHYRKLESGRANPRLHTIDRIADALGVLSRELITPLPSDSSYRYEVVCDPSDSRDNRCKSYGILLKSPRTTGDEIIDVVYDICSQKSELVALCFHLSQQQLDPIQFHDAIEDFLDR